MVACSKDLAEWLKIEYDKHNHCIVKYLYSVRELKISVMGKIKTVETTIKSFKTEIKSIKAKIKDLESKK